MCGLGYYKILRKFYMRSQRLPIDRISDLSKSLSVLLNSFAEAQGLNECTQLHTLYGTFSVNDAPL